VKGTANQRSLRIVFVLLVLAATTTASARVIYVDPAAPGTNEGTSWENAYKFLQDALADANSSDKPVEIRVAQGTYTPDRNSTAPDGTGDRNATFQLLNGVTLKGGYAGFAEPDSDVRHLGLYRTVLSGDLSGNDVNVADPCDLGAEATRSENCYHVLLGSGTDPNAVLDGFAVTGGNANGSWAQGYANCGGGMLNVEGSPTLANCTFTENSTGNPTEGGSGGGIDNESYSMPTIANCTFVRNYAVGTGGGMGNYRSAPTVIGCTFVGNGANGGAGLENSLATGLAPTTLNSCTFLGNMAERYGGGVYNNSSSPSIANCLFAGNSVRNPLSGVGGGMANWESEVMLENCTLVENRAHRRGGGMENSESFPTLVNCILWANSPGWEDGELTGGTTVTISYSDVQGGWPGEGNIDADPCFADPGHWDPNGTADDANDDFWVGGDYHLKSEVGRWDPNSRAWVQDDVTSGCIDAGYCEDYMRKELYPHGGTINMGAYGGLREASMSLCPVGHPADCTNDGVVDIWDLLMIGDRWLTQQSLLIEDVDRDGVVDFGDFAIMASGWLETVSGACSSEVFFDSFEYGEWDGLWTEDNQNDWSRTSKHAVDGSHSAEVDGPAEDATLTSVPIDLQGKTCAAVEFAWHINGRFDTGEYLAFDISTDGGITWIEKARLEGDDGDEEKEEYASIKLTGIAALQLRFRATVSDSGEDGHVDAVSVVASYH
jgi:hypothetical protein